MITDNQSAANVAACVASLFIPGLGQLLQMRCCRALAYFLSAIIVTVVGGLLLPFLVPWLFLLGASAFLLPTLLVGMFAAYDAAIYRPNAARLPASRHQSATCGQETPVH